MSDAPTIHERMVAILREMPAIGKNQRNQQQGFMFRGHDDVLNALNPLLAKHGVVIVPSVLERETSQRTTAKGSVMYEVNLHVRYEFLGAGGDRIQASTWGEGTDSGDKATNKAMTMAFKNVLNQAFAISSAEFKDADGDSPEPTSGRVAQTPAEEMPTAAGPAVPAGPPPSPQPVMISDAQHRKIGVLLKELNELQPVAEGQMEYVDQIKVDFGVASRKDLTHTEAGAVIETLLKWKKNAEFPA